MPLPQAKPDKRIYELLKNVDLENLTFADLQSVGQKIFAEQGAEDELRRLVLVNLARLSVAGEWNGLTETGGGAYSKLYNPANITPTSFSDELMQLFSWGDATGSQTNEPSSSYRTYYYMFPFYAQGSGSITEVRYRITLAHTGDGTALDSVIYTSDDNGQPKTKIGTFSLDLTSTGNNKSATITETTTGSMTLTAGELYWVAYKENGTTGASNIRSFNRTYVPQLAMMVDAGFVGPYNAYISATAPDTWTTSELYGAGLDSVPFVGGVFT